VIAVGASAGGLQALAELLFGLGPEFPPVVIVQHLDPRHKSQMAQVLSRNGGKPVKEAEAGEKLLSGRAYIGPPDEHLLVIRGRFKLAHSRLIRFSRPSIDIMFGSVAATYGENAIGVILSGSNRDGSDGIAAIHAAGGVTLAQDPATAEYRIMPQAAIDTGCIDMVVPIGDIGKTISKLLVEGRKKK
jgi:two-component system chemotaxis response regulator CheB